MSVGRHLQRIEKDMKAFMVLLKAGADLFFLCSEGIVNFEVFEMEIVNQWRNGCDDNQMTFHENVRFGRAEEVLARHQEFERFGLATSGQLFVKVTCEIYQSFKHMGTLLSRVFGRSCI
jgi:hypothetical protein